MSRASRLRKSVDSTLSKLGTTAVLRTSSKSYLDGAIVETNILEASVKCSPPQPLFQSLNEPVDVVLKSKVTISTTGLVTMPEIGDRLTLGTVVWIITGISDLRVNDESVGAELILRQENQVV